VLRLLWVTLILAHSLNAAEVQVFAAASLTHALREIGTNYVKESSDQLRFNFGASSLLARQIETGAPADIFFSADEEKVDYLQQRNLIVPETRKAPLSNRLVIAVSKDSKAEIGSARELLRVTRIALAEPNTVPAGIYAKKYLEKAGVWKELAPKVIPTENVRGALSAVETGNVDAAIVYQTDAAISQKVRVAYAVPKEQTPKVRYALAVIKTTADSQRAKRALEYLASPAAITIYRKHGFIVME
jgi:molybdate transport system substrate-binding protein